MQKVNGNSIFYTHDNKVIYYKEKGQSIEEDVTVIGGKDTMYCRNISTNNFYKVSITFEFGRAVLFRIHTINYTKNEFFENFNLVTELYYNISTGTKSYSINSDIGNYKFWKNIYTKEVLICDKKFIVQCGPNKGLDIGNISGHKMVNIPTKIGSNSTGKLHNDSVRISIKDNILTIAWIDATGSNLFNKLDIFREYFFFIDDEDLEEDELKELNKAKYPVTEYEDLIQESNGLGSYKQISSYPNLNNKTVNKPRDFIDEGLHQDWNLERQRQKRKEIYNLHSIWSESSRPVLPEWVTKRMTQVDIDEKIRTGTGIKNETKTNVELKLINLEDEENLMNEQVFKMKLIN